MRTLISAIVLLQCSTAWAQAQTHVVPDEYQHREGQSMRQIAGVPSAIRQQIIVSSELLSHLAGKELSSLSLRRDQGLAVAFMGGWVSLEIELSSSSRSFANPSNALIENQGQDKALVFRGRIEVPNSPVLNAEVSPWDEACVLHFPFSQDYLYVGGDLCIEIRPVFSQPPSTVNLWPVDAALIDHSGEVEQVSSSCSDFGPNNTWIGARDLVIGRTAVFRARGTPGGEAFMLLGSKAQVPLNLAFLGSPGCFLNVLPDSRIMATTFSDVAVVSAPEIGGRANVAIQIPADSNLLGREFYSQWIDMGPPITTSNTLRFSFSTDLPSLGMSIVSGAYDGTTPPDIGHVSIDVGPVMRFEYR